MEEVSWSVSPHPEAFKRQSNTADTLNRLASFIARVESKQGLGKSCKQLPPKPLSPPLQPLHQGAARPFACLEGGESFPCPADLLTHEDTQLALPTPHHQCSGCGQTFSLRSSLQLHNCKAFSQLFQPQTRSSPPYAASLIPDNSVDISAFDHPRVFSKNPYACGPCGKGFMVKQALAHHQKSGCDRATPAAQQSDDPASSALDSPLGSEEDSSSSNSLYVPEGESVCKCCSRTFRNEAAFRRHSRVKHSDDRDTDSSSTSETKISVKAKRGGFSCRSCEMVFSSTAKLSKHRKDKHSRGLKLKLPTEKNRLQPVLVRHHRKSTNTYTCQICSQVFFHHLSLWAHKRKHPASDFSLLAPPNNATKDCKSIDKPKPGIKLAPKLLIRKNPLTKAVTVVKKYPPKFHRPRKFPLKPLKRKQVPKNEEEGGDSNSEDSDFPCPSCPEVFSSRSELKAHTELHQSAVRRGRCSVCACEMDSLRWPGARRLRLYHCVLCQTGFATLEPFLTHCQGHLKMKVEEET